MCAIFNRGTRFEIGARLRLRPRGRTLGVLRSEFATEGGEKKAPRKRGAFSMLPTELLA